MKTQTNILLACAALGLAACGSTGTNATVSAQMGSDPFGIGSSATGNASSERVIVVEGAASDTAPVTTEVTPPAAAPAQLHTSVAAFRDICINNAPSFAGSAAAAQAYGIAQILDLGFTNTGSTADNSLAVQIKPGKECVVTTPSQSDNPAQQFASVIPGLSGTRFPAVAQIGNANFIFQHDRNGGEAFVMLKR